jgi:hypothetical protein
MKALAYSIVAPWSRGRLAMYLHKATRPPNHLISLRSAPALPKRGNEEQGYFHSSD